MTDLRALQVRVRRLSLVDHPTFATLGALSLIGTNNYNHLLFTVSLYRIGVLGFWGNEEESFYTHDELSRDKDT